MKPREREMIARLNVAPIPRTRDGLRILQRLVIAYNRRIARKIPLRKPLTQL